MSQTRLIKDWTPDRVEESQVAPHRYTWDRKGVEDEAEVQEDRRKFLAASPYQRGEVVYVDRGGRAVRARIIHVWFERDRFGDRRHRFQVQYETKAGTWSKLWDRTYPGPIQRGYKLAGWATDIPD